MSVMRLAKSPLGPSAHHFFENADKTKIWTQLRLHIYPHGSVARTSPTARLNIFGSMPADALSL